MINTRNESTWSGIGLRICMNTVSHPIEYAKVLIQVGHEPIPPYASTTLFGKPALYLPNVFKYVAYIYSVDGFFGCYRGLGPKLCANAISGITYQKVYESIDFEGGKPPHVERLSEEERRRRFVQDLKKEVLCRGCAIITSQPFTVIAVRMMAQFIGGETKYSGILSSIKEIFNENGLLGFFSGVVPRILGEILSLFIAGSLTFVINNYFLEDNDLKTYTSASITFVAGAITYPFQLVSNCMAVTNSGLAAGRPPLMPLYTSWTDCWSNLSHAGQIKRGSSLLFRYYTGPQVIIQGRPVVVSENGFYHSSN
ncbi:mitochondrial carrier homolog 2-like [Periplaneta americana]|uniref:mitochondrial carrier homolog 2-like n=1 Tax=Periplaneta americana TaxID=6978 RepID=UPI0037E761EA